MVEVWLDSAEINEMIRLAPKVSGFTTNPTLMRKANVHDYKSWAKIVLDHFLDKPVSFEVIADDFTEMERQARLLSSWGPNVYVKIPITNTKGESSVPLIRDLWRLNLNITAVMTGEQLNSLSRIVQENHIVSVFNGRIMDAGANPREMQVYDLPCKKLWASTREIYNLQMAEKFGYDIITLTPDLITKRDLKGKDLAQYSLETIQMFYNDAQKAGYTL